MAVGRVMMNAQHSRWPRMLLGGATLLIAGWLGWAYLNRPIGDVNQLLDKPEGMSSWMSPSVGVNATEAPVPTFKTGLEGLPRSLAGTEVAGELREDAQGALIIERGVRDVFDYFLSSRGEQADAVIDARIRAYVKNRLRPPAAQQALALLDAYLGYLQRLDGVASQSRGGASMEPVERLALLNRLRAGSFTPDVVQAFFGLEQLYDQYTVDKIAVFNDRSLTPVQKTEKLKALRQALPADLQSSLDATEVAQSLEAVTQEWRQRAGSVAELRAVRENLVGPEAADRLEALDRENQAWQARIQAYLQARSAIQADASLADAIKQERIHALMKASFSAGEQIRAESYERMADQKQLAQLP